MKATVDCYDFDISFMAFNQSLMSSGRSMSINSLNMSMPTSTVEISVRCTGLADKDVMSKSDPLCVMYFQVKQEINHYDYILRSTMTSAVTVVVVVIQAQQCLGLKHGLN